MAYIHPNDKTIAELVQNSLPSRGSLQAVCQDIFRWFDENIAYSRLNSPFFPLQRSDLDVLSMRCGTCGDYANLLVSLLQQLGYETRYAYVHTDCYGDAQDHICAAIWDKGQWLLIDSTQPYRKWYGFPCPHRDYELLTAEAFELRMKKEEAYWTKLAIQYGNESFAGLLYAPWIHEEILRQTEELLESVFFLLQLDEQQNLSLYAYLKSYTSLRGSLPVMSILSKGTQTYRFSCNKPDSLWDPAHWSRVYLEKDIPNEWKTEPFLALKSCIPRILPEIQRICAFGNISFMG